ncbi:MAG: hypothetical protein N4A70_05805 [Pelagimonas sp.]|jgi:hypothetical protein|nr:hypothetical protein [Pelagimonas sp.]
MPVTSFALLVLTVIATVVLTVWALSAWGLTVVPLLLVTGLLARWAMMPISHDDSSHP